jgi:hypothetical protein
MHSMRCCRIQCHGSCTRMTGTGMTCMSCLHALRRYINNTGLMWELGEQMSALLVFAEHRYEPLSHPALCGDGTQKCFAYCTTAQANADWASLIEHLRQQVSPHCAMAAMATQASRWRLVYTDRVALRLHWIWSLARWA